MYQGAGAVSGFGYRGMWTDGGTTGMVKTQTRFYMPGAGRFGQVDPARAGSNWYAYCDADPVNRSDPSGLAWHSVANGVWTWEDDGDGPIPVMSPTADGGSSDLPDGASAGKVYNKGTPFARYYAFSSADAFTAWHGPMVAQRQAAADALWAQERDARAAQRLANQPVARLYNPTTSQFEFFTDAGEADARAAELTAALSAQVGAAYERSRMLSGVRITAFSDDQWVGIQKAWKRDEALRERVFMGPSIGIGLVAGPELAFVKMLSLVRGGAAVARGGNAARMAAQGRKVAGALDEGFASLNTTQKLEMAFAHLRTTHGNAYANKIQELYMGARRNFFKRSDDLGIFRVNPRTGEAIIELNTEIGNAKMMAAVVLHEVRHLRQFGKVGKQEWAVLDEVSKERYATGGSLMDASRLGLGPEDLEIVKDYYNLWRP
jgi:RHS repeat-associated protein